MRGFQKSFGPRMAASVAAVLSLFAAALITREFAAQDVLHVYITSPITQFYRIYLDTGAGFPVQESMQNTYFPSEGRVNFPIPSNTVRLRLVLGETPRSASSAVRVCLERSLLVTRCSAGTLELALAETIRPSPDVPVFLVRCLFFVAATAFCFCFLLALIQPITAWWTRDAIPVFLIALALRGLFLRFFSPGGVSDSDLFLRYLRFHIFGIPGIRGVTYPVFITLLGTHIFAGQFFLGALGSVIALLLLRSLKPASRWDVLWALIATSLPVFLAMEGIILAESLSLFLMLTVLLAFRWIQKDGAKTISLVGLGAGCALLMNAKPQFFFVPILLAAALAYPWKSAARRLLSFGAPTLALYLFVVALDSSCGNFKGVSSTLGYSLFDHGQQGVDCGAAQSEPHLQYYCEARAALGPHAEPYAYTAWVIFPSMHRLGEPFPVVTGHYAALSARLIAKHPRLYVQTVTKSFFTFWTGEIPMVRNLLSQSNQATVQAATNLALPAERLFRDAIVLLFFVALAAVAMLRIKPDRDAFLFCAVMAAIVLVSAVLQALVESGRENPRFEIPTEPLLIFTIVFVTHRLVRHNR